jgi:hypothetical protein
MLLRVSLAACMTGVGCSAASVQRSMKVAFHHCNELWLQFISIWFGSFLLRLCFIEEKAMKLPVSLLLRALVLASAASRSCPGQHCANVQWRRERGQRTYAQQACIFDNDKWLFGDDISTRSLVVQSHNIVIGRNRTTDLILVGNCSCVLQVLPFGIPQARLQQSLGDNNYAHVTQRSQRRTVL